MKKIQEAQQSIIPDGIDGFGRRLANARKTAGYTTIDKLATQMRHQKSTVSRWEAGKNRPDYETLIELSELLNVTIDYLLTGTSSENVDASRRYGLSNDALNMLEELNQRIEHETPMSSWPRPITHPIMVLNTILSPVYKKHVMGFCKDLIVLVNLRKQISMRQQNKHYDALLTNSARMDELGTRFEENAMAKFLNLVIADADDLLDGMEYKVKQSLDVLFSELVNDYHLIDNSIQQELTSDFEQMLVNSKQQEDVSNEQS